MIKIRKTQIPVKPEFSLDLPAGFEFLRLMLKTENVFIFFKVNTESNISSVNFRIFATDEDMGNYKGEYLGSFFIGLNEWHLFHETKSK